MLAQVFTHVFARLLVFGSLTLLAAAPISAQTQTPLEPGVAFKQEFGPGWLSIVASHPDGGFVVAGRRFDRGDHFASADGRHPLVIRLGPDGRVRWEKAFANRDSAEVQAVQVIPGVGIRLTGFAGLSFDKATVRRLDWIAEIDDEGRVTRDESLDLDRPDHEGKFIPITPSTFAFYGSRVVITGTPGIDIFATDARGSRLWRAEMPDVAAGCEGAAVADPDGNVVAVVASAPPGMMPDGTRFRRFDARGQISRDQPFGAFKDACPTAIRSVPGAGFIVAGWRTEADGPSGWVALLNGDGSLVWERLFGPAENAVTAGFDAAPAPDGSLVVAGCADGVTPEGLVLRYSRTGDLTGERRFASADGVTPAAVQVAHDGSIVLAGVLDQRCGLISGKTSGGTAWVTALTPNGLLAPAR